MAIRYFWITGGMGFSQVEVCHTEVFGLRNSDYLAGELCCCVIVYLYGREGVGRSF